MADTRRLNRKKDPILFWEECLAIFVYNSIKAGELDFSSAILHEILGECTREVTDPDKRASWQGHKIRNVKSALGDGPSSANEGTLVYIREAAKLVEDHPYEAETLARKSLTKPLPTKLSNILFKANNLLGVEEPPISYGHESSIEGEWKLVLHFEKERDGKLPKLAKQYFRDKHNGRLFCEACNYNPESSIGIDITEAHHRTPLSEIEKPTETKVTDFIMLCPNCHRAMHKIENCDFSKLKTLVSKDAKTP